MRTMEEDVHKVVKERYGKVAEGSSCCCPGVSETRSGRTSQMIGYSEAECCSVPEGANLGLGCGNPTAIASIQPGETVLDLGSGAGFDCFLAAEKVGEEGQVIGVDMTPQMLEKARENAEKGGYKNVEFRKGQIEDLPVDDSTVDLIISNCVINLSPDKQSVFKEAHRVLKPGGQIMVSDIVLTEKLPDIVKGSNAAYTSCIAGAMLVDDYMQVVRDAGFEKVEAVGQDGLPIELLANDPMSQQVLEDIGMDLEEAKRVAQTIKSLKLSAVKPAT